MNVFLPFKQDKNPVLKEIEQHFNGTFIYGSYKNFDNHKVDVVNIHWPESIFDFSEPTPDNLIELEDEMLKWKAKAKIIFTRHNVLPHKSQSINFVELYQLILKYADGIIHLGEFSLNELKKSNPATVQIDSRVIYHPAYTLFKNEISETEARKKLGIPLNKKVILVFGSIRTKDELDLVISSFDALDLKDKHLIISNHNIYKPLPKTFVQRISKYAKTKIEKLSYSLKNNLTIGYDFIENNDVQVYLNASNVLFIPRIDLLNSGNLFLGFSFKKVVVGPAIGNITEILERTNNPLFEPNKIESVTKALKQGLSLPTVAGANNYRFVQEQCNPKNIAQSYHQFFKSIISNC